MHKTTKTTSKVNKTQKILIGFNALLLVGLFLVGCMLFFRYQQSFQPQPDTTTIQNQPTIQLPPTESVQRPVTDMSSEVIYDVDGNPHEMIEDAPGVYGPPPGIIMFYDYDGTPVRSADVTYIDEDDWDEKDRQVLETGFVE